MKLQLLSIAFATLVGFAVACATRSANVPASAQQAPSPYAQPNQQTYGGAQGQPVYATGHQYTECFAASTWFVQGRALNAGEPPRQTVRVPAGWTPMGGGAAIGGYPSIIFCR